ncbi:MAG: histidine phosphatase family protein, partial [Chloroflexi bacterium]|nr:histidine phosphatase family protein [Chloroflexota bacterium]
MPTDLFLIRHGHAIPVNRRYLHAPLTPLGQQQATQTGQHLRELHPSLDALYTSPIRRARETAAIIGALIGKAPQARSGIEEMTLLELPALALLALLSLLDPVEDYLQ